MTDIIIPPEPCVEPAFGRCRSPSACKDWGYCRERNRDDKGGPTQKQIDERKAMAAARRRAI